MATVSHIEIDPAESDEALGAAKRGDPAARWGALEACRQYLRLVVGNNRWSNRAGEPATSDLIQDTILEGWRGFSRFNGCTQQQLRAWLRVILVHAIIKSRRRPALARLESGSGTGSDQGPRSRRPAPSSSERPPTRQSTTRSPRCPSIIARPSGGGSGMTCRSRKSARGSRSPMIVPRSSSAARSRGCVIFWGRAMNRDDNELQLPGENEPARVIACDALFARPSAIRGRSYRVSRRPKAAGATGSDYC